LDPGVTRESLATLLSQEVSFLNRLADLLAHEHSLLVANDVDALDAAMQDRQIVVGQLLDIEEERRSLCRAHGQTADVRGLEQLLAWCDARGELKARMAESARSAIRCREMNDRNGALVQARMKHVQNMLGAITGQAPEAPATYGPKGAYSQPRSGRVFTSQA
jgi:flagellar biosynthesis/type III secretory pathway chaperone